MPFGTTVDNNILKHFVAEASWTQPSAIWVGLSTAAPGKTGAGDSPPSTGGYKRIEVTTAEWKAVASSSTENSTDQAYAQATADYSGGSNQTHATFYDDSVGGNYLGSKALGTAKPVLDGDTAKFLAGDLILKMAGTA
jgi:hypothetical protein